MACKRRKLDMQMKYCRKIYASYLRQNGGIESEIVDLLQGRVPRTVFARHYFRPSADYKDRVLAALKTLRQKIL
jgi:intergrase/recombinase